LQLSKSLYEMLPAEVAQAVREDEADNRDNNGRSDVDRHPALQG
jgi:hypothetical protein